MKILIIVLSAFFAFNSAVTAQTATKKEEQKIIFVCTMHPGEMKDIKNPYFGSEMLTCGSVRKEF